MLLSYSDTDLSILVYKFRPETIGFNMCAENTQPQLTFLALLPWELSCVIHQLWELSDLNTC